MLPVYVDQGAVWLIFSTGSQKWVLLTGKYNQVFESNRKRNNMIVKIENSNYFADLNKMTYQCSDLYEDSNIRDLNRIDLNK